MKVICINTDGIWPENIGQLEEGLMYTVVGESPLNADGSRGWLLAEAVNNRCPDYGFKKHRFIPCSDIDEQDRLTQKDKLFKELAETMPEKELPQQPFERGWRDLVLKMEGML